MRSLRRQRPPAEATARLDRDERVLAWATTAAGTIVVATHLGLWLPGDDGPRRIPWHEIDKASWREGVLAIVRAVEVEPGIVEDAAPVHWEIAEARGLPGAVHERVTRSVAVTEHHDLPGGHGVRIAGRRVTAQDGLSWLARFDHASSRHDAAAHTRAAELLEAARRRSVPEPG